MDDLVTKMLNKIAEKKPFKIKKMVEHIKKYSWENVVNQLSELLF